MDNQNENMNNQNNFNQPQDINEFNKIFNTSNSNKNTIIVEIAFWISILEVLLSFISPSGVYVLPILLCIYFGIIGLKTKKRKKAIASIVLSVLAVVIVILNVIL